jgi:hypothetical protein
MTKRTRTRSMGRSGGATKLIVKVDPSRSRNPAKHVTRVLRGVGAAGRVDEVFPGLRSGSSAGLVAVTLRDAADTSAQRATLKALRDDKAIAYVDTPKPRRPAGSATRARGISVGMAGRIMEKERRMAGTKKAAKKKAAKRLAVPTRTAKKPSLHKRAARDPDTGPSSKSIDESLKKGTSVSLDYFRGIIDWS